MQFAQSWGSHVVIRWLRSLAIWIEAFPFPFRPRHTLQASLLKALDSEFLTPHAQFIAAGGFDKVFANLVLKPTDHVVVLGGYHGDSTSFFKELSDCKVTAWEPVDEYATVLIDRFSQVPGIEVIQKAAWVNNLGIRVFLDSDGTGLSGKGEDHVLLQSSDFVGWLNELETTIRLIEINIEGSEYELLPNLLERANHLPETILIQFHDFKSSSALDRQSIKHLLSLQYECIVDYPWVWEQWNIRA